MSIINLSSPNLPERPQDKRCWGQLPGVGISYALSAVVKSHSGLVVVLVPDPLSASKLERELKFFLDRDNLNFNDNSSDNSNGNNNDDKEESDQESISILTFPDWETLPYDSFSPHQDIVSERLTTLYQLPNLKRGVLVVPIATLMHRLCPKEFLLQNTLLLKIGDRLDLENMRTQLQKSGYRCTPQVMEHGEFAIRGSLLDLFPTGSKTPFRIDLFGDTVDSIRIFNPDTQRSLEKVAEIRLLPAREYPLTEESIASFRTHWRELFEGDPRQSSVYLDVSQGFASLGLEYYLPLFFKETETLFDYIPDNSLIVKVEKVDAASDEFWQEAKERYEQYRHDRLRPILEPKKLFLEPQDVFKDLKRFPQLQLTRDLVEKRAGFGNCQMEPLPEIGIESRHEKPLARLEEFLNNFTGRVLFCVESAGRREVLKELLFSIGCNPVEMSSWSEYKNSITINSTIKQALIIAPLEEGMQLQYFPSTKSLPETLCIITESELLGKRVMQRRHRKARTPEMDMAVRSLAELSIGDPVVHIDHGIGRYLGLTHLTLSGQLGEFVTLEYAGGDKLYVPVASLHLISRYSSIDLQHAPLHRLGNAEWQKVKRKVLEQTRDVAAELLEIYARREAKAGFSFSKPDEQYDAFCTEFPFEETPDQQQAIHQVLQDLLSQKPMDRVVCGDVGFGKTEVALRAAFIGVQAGKQVAVLVPTTLLAQQHFQTFSDRFAGFPVRIEVMSRFRTRKEQEAVIEGLKEGKVDIVIGTHKLLQSGIQFKSLGLLIIDEEHRFGVRQKEAFKAFRSEVDILTLTATPIPRTLNMAMSGIRDLSIIATPPAKRLSIKTFVREKQDSLRQEAIMRELHRGGQVYYLHNVVESIERTAKELEHLVPSARIAVAHGQMRERELEQVMTDFYHHRYNVLVCTTIIETGIDIPTANTIIIDRADKFGLAQLHQLRGRVGRSHHQAYAFCLVPPQALMTADAVKRLDALASLEELGSGFTLATHDLEIRGAGELLGEEQSGNIQAVGFSLFMELLDHAVQALKAGLDPALEDPFKKSVEIDLQLPALIPEEYIPDVHTRLVLYKRISNAASSEALNDLISEIVDRFGLLPEQTGFLFKITELKLQAQKLGICKIDANARGGRLEFVAKPTINPTKIIQLIQTKSNIYQLEGPQKLKFKQDLSDRQVRLKEVMKLIDFLR